MRRNTFITLLLALVLTVTGLFPALAEEASQLRGYIKSAGYEYVELGAYPTDADGTARPIVWRVLRAADGEAYLLSEYILFHAPVHGDYDHYKGWEQSDLFAYLNGAFLDQAFTAEEQAALLICPEYEGLVTLITADEMKNASLGFSSNSARLCESTAWAKIHEPLFEIPASNGKGKWKANPPLYLYSKGGKKYSPWWSRTRSADYPHEQRRVMDEGKIGRISTGNTDLGVRPAVTVDLARLAIAGGSGTLASPYQVTLLPQEPEPPAPQDVTQPADTDEAGASVTEDPTPAETDVTGPADTEKTEPAEANVTEPADPDAAISADAGNPEQPEPEQQPAAQIGFTAAARPDTIHERFPALTAEGFLPEGEPEFVYESEEEGLWLYASQTLRIQIDRRNGINSKKEKLRWFEARIFCKDETELFHLFPYDEANYTRYGDRFKALADKIAVQHQLVFAINSDYFIYRIERDHEEDYDYPIGVIVRNGRVLYERPRNMLKSGAESTVYPPLDVMALYPDGSVTLHRNSEFAKKELSAADLLAAGATDTLSFGPILVENGEVSPRSQEFGNTPNPRTAFGMVEPGYYVAVMVESRTEKTNPSDPSYGESCIWLGQKMAELGCASAINLDGGATSAMLFMGKQINKSGNYGDITNRTQNELLGIGHSDAIR